MTDRFHSPEGPNPSDPRRIFIPSPSAPPAGRTGAPPARPRPGQPVPPGPVRDPRRGQPGPGGPGGPGGRGPGGPPDPYRPRRDPNRPGGPGGPGGDDPFGAPRRSWFRRIRWRWVLAALPVLLVLALIAGYLWANSVFNRIDRVETEGTLSGGGLGSGTNYLLVGSDSREDIEGGQAGITDGDFPPGQRSDTMLILHTGGDGTKLMSVPRDLYVEIADTGESGKINGAFNGGPPRLISTIADNLDIPIHRYVEVDFVSFAGLVDSLGGITINFEHPAYDPATGLLIPEAGPVELNGEQALQYVRSRHYHEVIDGVDQGEDPTADLGRIQRQQAFLQAVFAELGDTKNPITLARTLSSTAEGLRIDDEMGLFDAVRLAWTLRGGLNPEPLELPTTSGSNESGSVLLLNEEEAQPVLDQLR